MTVNGHPAEGGKSARHLEGDVSARRLTYEFPGRTLWSDLSFEVAAGHLAALRGQSGSGKTTLLQCVGSLENPTSGEIEVAGTPVRGLRGSAHRRFLRRSVGFVFQNSGIVASWSVRKNLEVSGVSLSGPSRSKRFTPTAIAAFEQFALSPDIADTPAFRLSGGEQQRVAMMRLALRRPAVLLLDEPTSALDDTNTERLLDFLGSHCRSGGSAIVATHDARVIDRADVQIVL